MQKAKEIHRVAIFLTEKRGEFGKYRQRPFSTRCTNFQKPLECMHIFLTEKKSNFITMTELGKVALKNNTTVTINNSTISPDASVPSKA